RSACMSAVSAKVKNIRAQDPAYRPTRPPPIALTCVDALQRADRAHSGHTTPATYIGTHGLSVLPDKIRHRPGGQRRQRGRRTKQAPGAGAALLSRTSMVTHFGPLGGRCVRGRRSTVRLMEARLRGPRPQVGCGSVRRTELWVSRLFMSVW